MNRFLVVCVLSMLALTSVLLLITKENTATQTQNIGSGKALIGGNFTLTNQENKPVSNTDFLGKYMLVFFGFTHCPDICPTTMATLTSVMENLGADADKFAPILISVDPKRDTPQQLQKYLSNFDKRIIGLTGTNAEITSVAGHYKAFFSEVVPETLKDDPHAQHAGHDDHKAHGAEANYMVDHSGFLYVMDKKGEYIQHFPYDVSVDELTQTLKALP